MSQDRIDFSPLDPSRDEEHWDRTVQNLVSRALAARARPRTSRELFATWVRPALAVAAAVALMIWAGVLLTARTPPRASSHKIDPASVLSRWAVNRERPSPSRIVEVFGAHHVQK